MPSAYYPYEEAKAVPLGNLQSGIFTNSGTIRKEAEYTARRFCAKYNLSYPDFWSLVERNYDFYWNDYRKNNPDATKPEILKAQKESFIASTRDRIASQFAEDYISTLDEFVWLPSESPNPSDEHEMYYGEIYSKENPPPEYPGQRPRCQCGIGVP